MSPSRPSPTDAFVAIDLDNVIDYKLDERPDDLDRAIDGMNRAIEAKAGLRIRKGYASMNRRTAHDLRGAVITVLGDWGIEFRIVPVQPESADKDLFYAVGRAVGQGYKKFVIVSKDKGFTELAHRVRGDVYDAEFVVVVDHETSGVLEQWSRVDAVRFLELKPRPSTRSVAAPVHVAPQAPPQPVAPAVARPVAVSAPPSPPPPPDLAPISLPVQEPAPMAPLVSAPPAALEEQEPELAVAAAVEAPLALDPSGPGSGPLSRKPAAARHEPRLRPAVAVTDENNYVLQCDLCGRRSLQQSAARNSRCRHCGSSMRTGRDFPGVVVPGGKVPYQDGPLLEVWSKGVLRRRAVLCVQSTTFGRDDDATQPFGQIKLGDLIDVDSRISGRQFTVSKHGGRCFLTNVGSREMFDQEDRPLEVNAEVEVSNGQEFYLNNRKNPDHAGSLLKFVLRTAPRADADGDKREEQ